MPVQAPLWVCRDLSGSYLAVVMPMLRAAAARVAVHARTLLGGVPLQLLRMP